MDGNLNNGLACDEAAKNAWCNPSIAKKNVSAAKNGCNLMLAVIPANTIAPKFIAKRSEKQQGKSDGWPEIQITGADPNGSKTPKTGAGIIRVGKSKQMRK